MKLCYRGKVRDVYELDDDLLLVASDRVSVYDVVLPTEIPGKGAQLTAASAWWFDHLRDIVPNHMISVDDVPEQFAGRAMRCTPLQMMPVECIVRGYLAGGGFERYAETGSISGVPLPPGLIEGSRLPRPIFTPTSKAGHGEHDRPMSFDETADLVGSHVAESVREIALALYTRAAAHLFRRGLILADTKFEFGRDTYGRILLGDEAVTCDSSRIWRVRDWQPGRPGPSLDKQVVRDWVRGTGWDRRAPGPAIPPEIVERVGSRYDEAYRTATRGWGQDRLTPRPSPLPR
jgi:phosphoribosylaminoimidazole-succinocarboxamide synthase